MPPASGCDNVTRRRFGFTRSTPRYATRRARGLHGLTEGCEAIENYYVKIGLVRKVAYSVWCVSRSWLHEGAPVCQRDLTLLAQGIKPGALPCHGRRAGRLSSADSNCIGIARGESSRQAVCSCRNVHQTDEDNDKRGVGYLTADPTPGAMAHVPK
jgi:hypothetical protein